MPSIVSEGGGYSNIIIVDLRISPKEVHDILKEFHHSNPV